MPNTILPIVEGHSEMDTIPLLIRRIARELCGSEVTVVRPFRVKRYSIVRTGEIEKAIGQGLRDRQNVDSIIVTLDADDDCPVLLGSELSNRCGRATHLPVAVVLANKELEGWFLGAKNSLRNIRGIGPNANPPPNPESIRAAKGRLSQNMIGKNYLGIDDQPALAHAMNLQTARTNCPSFDKFVREVMRLVCLNDSL